MQPGMSHMGQYRTMKEGQDMLGDPSLSAASPQANKTESKKHPSLPKEVNYLYLFYISHLSYYNNFLFFLINANYLTVEVDVTKTSGYEGIVLSCHTFFQLFYHNFFF